jgi:hypothetical protein
MLSTPTPFFRVAQLFTLVCHRRCIGSLAHLRFKQLVDQLLTFILRSRRIECRDQLPMLLRRHHTQFQDLPLPIGLQGLDQALQRRAHVLQHPLGADTAVDLNRQHEVLRQLVH